MWQLIILIISITIAALYFFSCNSVNGKISDINNLDTIVLPEDSINNVQKPMTKNEIAEKLKALAESKSINPDDLNKGAMCYSMVAPPNRAEYTCPKCSEKTLYVGNYAYKINQEINAARSYGKSLAQFNMQLVESEFCKKCQKNKTENPSLILIINYKDQSVPRIVDSVSAEDLQILLEFLNGSKVHQAGQGREVELKDYSQRLSALLGIDMKLK